MQNFFLIIGLILVALLAYYRINTSNEQFLEVMESRGITPEKVQGWIYPDIDIGETASKSM